MPIRKEGQLLQADFYANTGGLNNTDSPFAVRDDQATDGQNWDYISTGGIRKRLGHSKQNASADTQLTSLGLGLLNTKTGTKTVIRAAGTKLQAVNLTAETFTDLTEDTLAAASDFLPGTSTVRVINSAFNTPNANTLWMAGGGLGLPNGAYSSTKATENGTATPTGTLGTPTVAGSGGSFGATGTYFYVVSFIKASTLTEGNVALDASATLSATTEEVTLDLTGITGLDTTKYEQINIYRSVVDGGTAFTVGDLIATIASTSTSYTDLGSSTIDNSNIPRAGNTILDQSPLPAGTYNVLTTFKRRLVTSQDSTIRLSDLNRPEAWPTVNTITIPSGGEITALGVISNTSATSAETDELLVIFKERELWVVTGASTADWALHFIDSMGCPAQSLLTSANGYLMWLDARGIYMWNGAGKPTYVSRTIENYFSRDGNIDLAKITQGSCAFYRKNSLVIWQVPDRTTGVNKLAIKFDLRISLPQVTRDLLGNVMEGAFTVDQGISLQAIESMIPPGESAETVVAGDDAGFVYKMFDAHADGGAGIDYKYQTSHLTMGVPGRAKRYHKVILWVEELGDWNITLDYWSNYRVSETEQSQKAVAISAAPDETAALWDVGFWDQAFWDDYTSKIVAITYNLSASDTNGSNAIERNNVEGDSLRLRFSNNGADQPVTIYGFSILYSEIGLRKGT